MGIAKLHSSTSSCLMAAGRERSVEGVDSFPQAILLRAHQLYEQRRTERVLTPLCGRDLIEAALHSPGQRSRGLEA